MDDLKNGIKDIFDNFSNIKVMIIGDVMIDSYLWGKVERISPEAPVPIVSVSKRDNRPGGAANVALNVKSLGATPYLCSVIGNDVRGKQFLEILDKLGLPKDGIICSNERITTTKFRIIGNNVQMLRVDEEIDTPLTSKESNLLEESITSIINKTSPEVIIFQDYNKGTLSPSLIEKVINLAYKLNIPVVVDPKHKNFTSFKNVKLFKPNLKELKEGLKSTDDFSGTDEFSSLVTEFQKEQNIEMLLLTLSEKGVYISYKKESGKYEGKLIPAHIRSIADVSGAGDTVISVAALCIAMKLEPLFMASLSNLAGGLVCEKAGVVPIEKDVLYSEAIKHCKILNSCEKY